MDEKVSRKKLIEQEFISEWYKIKRLVDAGVKLTPSQEFFIRNGIEYKPKELGVLGYGRF